MTENTETAILAGGCFWGMQDLIRKRPGIVTTRVGYSGGDVANATYRHHGTHAEAIEIIFDPTVTSYRDILAFFFQIHDPTTKDRQGNDRGTSYRSAILLRQRGPAPNGTRRHRRRRGVGTLAGLGGDRSRAGRSRSGRPNLNTWTTCRTIPTVTPATSHGRAGYCRVETTWPSRNRTESRRRGSPRQFTVVAMRRFSQVDVFTNEFLLGNPVAVVHDADALTTQQMAALARWTNLSETTFLLTPSDAVADYSLRIFTPNVELPFAGHPTLGSARAWLEAGGVPPTRR